MTPSVNHAPIPESLESVAADIVDAALRVHRALGPGLLESVYEVCLAHELTKRGHIVGRQIQIPVAYDGMRFDAGFRIDLLIGGEVVIELKAVNMITDVHRAQLLTYMKLAEKRLGFLINFNEARIKDGIKRLVL